MMLHYETVPLLQNRARREGGRCVHEPDPHLPAQQNQPLRLPHDTAKARRPSAAEPSPVAALELSADLPHQRNGLNFPCLNLKNIQLFQPAARLPKQHVEGEHWRLGVSDVL